MAPSICAAGCWWAMMDGMNEPTRSKPMFIPYRFMFEYRTPGVDDAVAFLYVGGEEKAYLISDSGAPYETPDGHL
ncbi:hypothetical protein AB0I81_40085 [Nonomuraea sp. NPDC050404]|uniref:hypothetical protein n=1 Tax=Nonomuraea sp. NPDC050404 TaxID=3155783 RepID=UPI0033C20422